MESRSDCAELLYASKGFVVLRVRDHRHARRRDRGEHESDAELTNDRSDVQAKHDLGTGNKKSCGWS